MLTVSLVFRYVIADEHKHFPMDIKFNRANFFVCKNVSVLRQITTYIPSKLINVDETR